MAYNEENHITPQAIQKSKSSVLVSNADTKQQAQPSKATKPTKAYSDEYREHVDVAADPIVKYMSKEQLQKAIERTRKQMVEAAKKNGFHRSGTISGRAYKTRRFISKNNHDYLNL